MKRLAKTALIGTALMVAGQLCAQALASPGRAAAPNGAAEDAQPSSSPEPAAPAPAPRAKKPLSPEEMKARGAELVTQVRTDMQHVQYLQGIARRDKDVIKLSCVNDKFIQLKAESNLFDMAYAGLLTSLDSSTDRGAKYDMVTDRAKTTHKARLDADGCIGAVELGTQDSSHTSPEIIDDPTASLPFGEGYDTVIEPPAFASPFS
jgi:hypothetical protein